MPGNLEMPATWSSTLPYCLLFSKFGMPPLVLADECKLFLELLRFPSLRTVRRPRFPNWINAELQSIRVLDKGIAGKPKT